MQKPILEKIIRIVAGLARGYPRLGLAYPVTAGLLVEGA